MKATLMIEAAPAVLAAILANLPAGATVTAGAAPSPAAAPQMPANPTGGDDDDDGGPVNASAPAFDTTGLPWDERIHAATKGTNADGSWKLRRGGPKGAELATIMAQLRATSGNNSPAPQPQPSPAPVPSPMPSPVPSPQPVPAPVPQMQPVPSPQPVPAPVPQMPANPEPAPIAQPVPVATPVAAPTGAVDFPTFMQHLQLQMQKPFADGQPTIHADYLAGVTAEIAQQFGQQLGAITDIARDPNMINYAVQRMQIDGRW